MRFLFGLCTGAVLLLVLAGDPGGQITRAMDLAVPWLSQRLDALRAPGTERDASPADRAAEDAEAAEDVGAAPAAGELWPEDAPLPEAFGDAYAWWGPHQEASASALEALAGTAPAQSEAAVAATAPGSIVDEGPTIAPEPVMEPTEAVASDAPTSLARSEPVWIPFHSERSAAGFAQRLARALDHRFDVRKDGPGRYQVVFPYEDEAGRDALLARVAMLTGSRP